jgi:DNA-directed RNA polymerase subunit alpha
MEYKYLSDTVEVKKVKETDTVGTFHIEGLYAGYGTTIGNSLRRVLLSSLPGAAISQVKIKGVKHEFSTIPGMMEDVVEFTMNLKKVRFNFKAEEPQTLKLKVKGQKDVKAGDIESTTLVEVVNKDLYLASLTDKKTELDIEVTVDKGLGYVPVEDRKNERLPIGTIVLDCIYSPIKNVQFDVEYMRVGEDTDYNRLKITIETDGSISPSRAFHQASNILSDHYGKISASSKPAEKQKTVKEEKVKETKEEKPKTKKTENKKTTKKTTKK